MSKITYAKASLWPEGILAHVLVVFDDLYPDDTPEFDHGGNMGKEGVIEKIILGDIQKNFPRTKFFFFTIPNARERWIDETTLEIIPPDTYRLSKHPRWVEWIKDKVENKRFYLGYHGWEHIGIEGTQSKPGTRMSHVVTTEFRERNKEDTINRLILMQNEFEKVGLKPERVFRPPAGAVNEALYDFIADNNILFAGFHGEYYYPRYRVSLSGKPIMDFDGAVEIYSKDKKSVLEKIDKAIASRGLCQLYMHFCNNTLIKGFPRGVTNGLTEENVLMLKEALEYINKHYGDRVRFSSYQEMVDLLKVQQRLNYIQEFTKGGTLVIKTRNTSGELEGASWNIAGYFRKIIIKDRYNKNVCISTIQSPDGIKIVAKP